MTSQSRGTLKRRPSNVSLKIWGYSDLRSDSYLPLFPIAAATNYPNLVAWSSDNVLSYRSGGQASGEAKF